MNRYDQRQLHDMTFHACVAAVAKGFPHLSVEAILSPPHPWFDAALARQIAIHLMVHRFHIPKRRVALLQERSRESVSRGLRTIDERLLTPTFETHYRRIETYAEAFFQQEQNSEAA